MYPKKKPDLALTDSKEIAPLILSGRVTLDEIPLVNRKQVETEASKLAKERTEAEKKAKAKVKKKKESDDGEG